MISSGIVPRVVGRNDSHPPAGFMIGIGQQVNCGLDFSVVEQPEPHRHRTQYAKDLDLFVATIQCEAEQFLVSRPEGLVYLAPALIEIMFEVSTDVLLANQVCEIRKCLKGLGTD